MHLQSDFLSQLFPSNESTLNDPSRIKLVNVLTVWRSNLLEACFFDQQVR